MNFAFIQMSFSVNGVSMVNKRYWSILRSPHILISRLFTSSALLFGLSFRGTISDIVKAFVSDFNDSARSMTDLDI